MVTTRWCQRHIQGLLVLDELKKTPGRYSFAALKPFRSDLVQRIIAALDKPWTLMGRRQHPTDLLEEFLDRKARNERWLCIDIGTSKKGKRIWQLSLVDYDTNETVLNEYLEHGCERSATRPLGCFCNAPLGSRHSTPEDIARKLKTKKVDKHTKLLAWCTNYHDVTGARKFLAADVSRQGFPLPPTVS